MHSVESEIRNVGFQDLIFSFMAINSGLSGLDSQTIPHL